METKKQYNINYKQRVINRINKGHKILLSTIQDHNITCNDVDVSNIILHNDTKNNIIFNSKKHNLLDDVDSTTKITVLQTQITTLNNTIDELRKKANDTILKYKTKCKELEQTNKVLSKENTELRKKLDVYLKEEESSDEDVL